MDFKFPDVGEGIQEGVLVKWLVKVGEKVERDAVLCEVETDKAVVEIPSPESGVVAEIYHREGETVKVGEVLVKFTLSSGEEIVEDQGGVVGAIEDADKSKKVYEGPLFAALNNRSFVGNQARDTKVTEAPSILPSLTSPSLNKNASLQKPELTEGKVDYEPLTQTRKAIVAHLEKSASVYSVTQTHFLAVDNLVAYRRDLNERLDSKGLKLSYLPFIILALAETVKNFPRFNAQWSQEHSSLLLKRYFNLGLAVDTPDGLIVPVMRAAGDKSLTVLAQEIADCARLARERKIPAADLRGQSITISNYGALGTVIATPLINHPDTCIVGVGALREIPTVKNGKVAIGWELPLSLTYDHRFNDGADAARFLNAIDEFLLDIEAKNLPLF